MRWLHFALFKLEPLEARQMSSATPIGYSADQIRRAYGFDGVNADGTGQIIAIVDAYTAPTIQRDLRVFNAAMGLPNADGRGKPVLSVVSPNGRPPVDSGWAVESSLDVQWAHAIAPRAKILLVQARSASFDDMMKALDYARNKPGVSAISMSWGAGESDATNSFENHLVTPANHVGLNGLPGKITFVASSGDTGGVTSWPATSPYVVAVGGTKLTVSRGVYSHESGWSGSGGGISQFEWIPTQTPDLGYVADPSTGVAVYDSTPFDGGRSGWFKVGGTSAGSPQVAAMVALADEVRARSGLGSLDSQETLSALYSAPASDFHDITTGSNGFVAGPGYDLVTGLGSPVAGNLVRTLAETPAMNLPPGILGSTGKTLVPPSSVPPPQSVLAGAASLFTHTNYIVAS